jgi:hypothetical protein
LVITPPEIDAPHRTLNGLLSFLVAVAIIFELVPVLCENIGFGTPSLLGMFSFAKRLVSNSLFMLSILLSSGSLMLTVSNSIKHQSKASKIRFEIAVPESPNMQQEISNNKNTLNEFDTVNINEPEDSNIDNMNSELETSLLAKENIPSNEGVPTWKHSSNLPTVLPPLLDGQIGARWWQRFFELNDSPFYRKVQQLRPLFSS